MSDGQGRHVLERVVSGSLWEHVVYDGEQLWHVSGEIRLASKRPFSRFHHREFSNIVCGYCRIVECDLCKVLRHITNDADGMVKVLDGNGKE